VRGDIGGVCPQDAETRVMGALVELDCAYAYIRKGGGPSGIGPPRAFHVDSVTSFRAAVDLGSYLASCSSTNDTKATEATTRCGIVLGLWMTSLLKRLQEAAEMTSHV